MNESDSMPISAALVGLGPIFFLGGAVWFVLGLIERKSERRLARRGKTTSGTVIEVFTYPEADDLQTGQYRLLVEYQVGGFTFTRTSRLASTNWANQVGQTYTVVYDPDDPSRSRLQMDLRAGPAVWSCLACSLIGLGAFIVGVLIHGD